MLQAGLIGKRLRFHVIDARSNAKTLLYAESKWPPPQTMSRSCNESNAPPLHAIITASQA